MRKYLSQIVKVFAAVSVPLLGLIGMAWGQENPATAEEPPAEVSEEPAAAEELTPEQQRAVEEMAPSSLDLVPGSETDWQFDVPVFDTPADRPDLGYLPGWVEPNPMEDDPNSEEARRDAEALSLLLAPRGEPVRPLVPPAPAPQPAAGTGGLLLMDEETLQDAQVIFEVDDYLLSMSNALSAFSVHAVLASFAVFNNIAELHESGLSAADRALKSVDVQLNLLRVSRERIVRLRQLELAAEGTDLAADAEDASPSRRIVRTLDALETQGQALRRWILTGGYTPPRDYIEAEEATRSAINQLVAPGEQ